MRFLIPALSLCVVLAQDARNTHVPNTDTHFTMKEYRTLAEWEARKAQLRKQILSAAGLLPMPVKTPLNPRIFGRLERSGYSVEKVLIETMPGFYLGGNLYRPLSPGKHPAILTPHGHWSHGRLEDQSRVSIPGRCINFARQGYVVFSYDMLGYNDTTQLPHKFGGRIEQLWSFGPLGLQLWNSIRAVDFVQSLGDVDPERIAATGASGGGTQTFLLAAVDDRVKWSAPVNMVSAIMQGGCRCENAPNLRVDTFNVELAAMMAPRPMLLVSATGDWTRNVPSEEFPAIRRIYALYGKAGDVEQIQIDGPHNYNRESREAVYRFFGRRILNLPDADRIAEESFQVEKPEDLRALNGRALPENALDYDGLFRQWKAAAQTQNERTRDIAELRERLRLALGAEWPSEVSAQNSGEPIVLSRPGKGDSVPGLLIPGSGAPVLLADEKGAAAARKREGARRPIASGRTVLAIDAFQTGSAEAPRDRSHEHFVTFNRSDDALRVQDILTALKYLSTKYEGKPELICAGKAAVWCTFAAAVAPIDVKLRADLGEFQGTEEDFAHNFFVPGILRAGGLDAARRILKQVSPQ